MKMSRLKKMSKDELINLLYNQTVEHLADYGKADKRIPYIGGSWHSTDFAGKNIHIGRIPQIDYVGIMENNKWYPERKMTKKEVDKFISMVDKALEHQYKNENELKEIWDWFQTLDVKGEFE